MSMKPWGCVYVFINLSGVTIFHTDKALQYKDKQ